MSMCMYINMHKCDTWVPLSVLNLGSSVCIELKKTKTNKLPRFKLLDMSHLTTNDFGFQIHHDNILGLNVPVKKFYYFLSWFSTLDKTKL